MVPRNSLFREQTEHSAASRGGAFSHPRTREEARLARPDPAFLCASPQTTPFYARVAQVFTPGGGSAPSGEAQTGQRKKTNDTQERATLIAGLMRKQKKTHTHTHTHTQSVLKRAVGPKPPRFVGGGVLLPGVEEGTRPPDPRVIRIQKGQNLSLSFRCPDACGVKRRSTAAKAEEGTSPRPRVDYKSSTW